MTPIVWSNQDTELEKHCLIHDQFPEPAFFDVLADLEYRDTPRYDRVTGYLIDTDGIIRQVFPMQTYSRAPWEAILHEIDRLGIGRERPEYPDGAGPTSS